MPPVHKNLLVCFLGRGLHWAV